MNVLQIKKTIIPERKIRSFSKIVMVCFERQYQ